MHVIFHKKDSVIIVNANFLLLVHEIEMINVRDSQNKILWLNA